MMAKELGNTSWFFSEQVFPRRRQPPRPAAAAGGGGGVGRRRSTTATTCRLVVTGLFAYGLAFWTKHQLDYNSEVINRITGVTYYAYGEASKPAATAADGGPLVATDPFCPNNPYIPVLRVDHAALQRFGTWVLDVIAPLRAAVLPAWRYNHRRFRVFEEVASCLDNETTCVGGPCGDDTSKVVCGLGVLNGGGAGRLGAADADTASGGDEPRCVVYSIGGNNQWEFEVDMLARTTCEVHTFDCTGAIGRFVVPPNDDGRLHFHHECLHGGTGPKPGTNFLTLEEMTTKYNHTQVDLFKMDIEGYEWGVFDAFYHQYISAQKGESSITTGDGTTTGAGNPACGSGVVLPMQILVEVHYRTHIKELFPTRRKDWKSEKDVISLARNLFEMGYIVVKHDDNAACRFCVELTLVRAYC